jgi:hypothetical protein
MLATIVEQAESNILPHGMWPIQPDGVGLLNFNDAKAAQAFHAKHMSRDFG